MAGDVDGDDFLEAEVPWEVGHYKRRHKTSAGSIHVDGAINFVLHKEIIDCLDILVLSSVGGANDGADTNSVLVNELDSLLWVDNIAFIGAVDITFFNIEIPGRFLPTDLDGGVHDDVGFRGILAFSFALVLPAPLHSAEDARGQLLAPVCLFVKIKAHLRQSSQHNGLGRPNCARAHRILGLICSRRIEQSCDHADTTILDIGSLRVLLIVDEVLGEGFGHEFFNFLFLRTTTVNISTRSSMVQRGPSFPEREAFELLTEPQERGKGGDRVLTM